MFGNTNALQRAMRAQGLAQGMPPGAVPEGMTAAQARPSQRVPAGLFGGRRMPVPTNPQANDNGVPQSASVALPEADGSNQPVLTSAVNTLPAQADNRQPANPLQVPGDVNGAPLAPIGPLGGSMREPFDYQAAMQALMPPQEKRGTLRKIAGVLGPVLMAAGGNQAGASAFINQMASRRASQQDQRSEAIRALVDMRYKDYARQNTADLRAANPFTIGRNRMQYDPANGQSSVLYDGAEDYELYAEELGLEPGSEEYFQAAEDYVLRSSGQSAHERDMELDDHRTSNDEDLEGVRYGNRVNMENLRQGNRRGMVSFRNANRPPAKPRASPASSSAAPRQTATDGQGKKVEWDGKTWVPVG